MKVVFISGPYRGPNAWAIYQHVMAAMAVALEVWRLGAVAICPHANTTFFQDAGLADEVWLEGDLELLRRCDAVLLVEGWQESVGAQEEAREAHASGIPTFTNLDSLNTWLTLSSRGMTEVA